MIRLGIAGLGQVADHQLAAIALSGHFRLVAGCDLDVEKSGKLPASAAFYPSLEELLDSAGIDALVIAVPNDQHVATTRAALRAGCHGLVEKPAAPSLGELRSLYDEADDTDRLLHVAFHAAFAKELLWFVAHGPGDLGPLRGFRSGFYDPYVEHGVVQDGARSLGGSWVDSGINALSVVGRLIDAAGLVMTGSTHVEFPGSGCSEVQRSAAFSFVSEDGGAGFGTIDTNWTVGLNCKYTELVYDRAIVLLDHSGQRVLRRSPEGPWETVGDFGSGTPRLVQHYVGVFDDFATALSKGADNRVSAMALHELLFAAYGRARTPEPCHSRPRENAT